MKESASTNGRDPSETRTWKLLARDMVPEPTESLWPGIRQRTLGSERQPWLPRLSFAGACCACLAVGLWCGLDLVPRDDAPAALADFGDYVEGSYLAEESWTLDGFYLMAENQESTTGGTP